jgi:uncharacterized delta-60 repeat protein
LAEAAFSVNSEGITMKKLILILLIISCILTGAAAQVQQQWIQRFNGPVNFNDVAYAMTLDASGNIYVTGTMNAVVGTDIATIKYNSSGAQEWLQTFSGGTHDAAFAITTDNSGNVYVAGSSQALGSDYVTIKYNSSGAMQWVQFYEGPVFEEDVAVAVAVDASGNVYVTGYSTGDGTSFDYATIKYNSSGAEQWVQRYNDPGNGEDVAGSLALDASGNIYVTGRSNYDYTTIKYNPSGVQQWIKTYNGPGNSSDGANFIRIDASDNIYLTGMSTGNGTEYDYATLKYNSSGTQLWDQRFSSPGNDIVASLAIDGSGNVYVTGTSNGNYATIKYNSGGVQQWVSSYNGPANAYDQASSLAIDIAGNVYVTGTSFGNPTTQYDYSTVKYNTSGAQQWEQRYNGPGNFYDTPYSIAVDGSGNVYVTGSSGGSGSGLDYTTIKYSQLTGLQHVSSETPDNFALYQSYPNPFNPTSKIKFDLPNQGLTRLVIYDILGKVAATLINEELNPGIYEVEWNAANYPSGTYFYRLITREYTETKKMILIK